MWFIHNLSLIVLGSAGTGWGVFKQTQQIQDTSNTWNTWNTRNTEYIPNLNQLIALECADGAKVKGYEQLASYSLGRLGEFLFGIM